MQLVGNLMRQVNVEKHIGASTPLVCFVNICVLCGVCGGRGEVQYAAEGWFATFQCPTVVIRGIRGNAALHCFLGRGRLQSSLRCCVAGAICRCSPAELCMCTDVHVIDRMEEI